MNKTIALTLPLVALLSMSVGCVYYEDCGTEDWEEGCTLDEFDFDEDCLDGEDCEEQEEAAPIELSFAPGHAEQGETIPGILTLEGGDLDLSQATLVFYGPVDVLASVNEAGQITTIITIDADAALGPVDLVLELPNGDAELLPAAFEIFATDSGNSGSDWTSGSSGSGSDDGECE
jgi:hypothetical protein